MKPTIMTEAKQVAALRVELRIALHENRGLRNQLAKLSTKPNHRPVALIKKSKSIGISTSFLDTKPDSRKG